MEECRKTDKKIEGVSVLFKTIGNKSNPVILFFHAMGVIGESSMPVAEKMKEGFSYVVFRQRMQGLELPVLLKIMEYLNMPL